MSGAHRSTRSMRCNEQTDWTCFSTGGLARAAASDIATISDRQRWVPRFGGSATVSILTTVAPRRAARNTRGASESACPWQFHSSVALGSEPSSCSGARRRTTLALVLSLSRGRIGSQFATAPGKAVPNTTPQLGRLRQRLWIFCCYLGADGGD